jgi:hypothetical protein
MRYRTQILTRQLVRGRRCWPSTDIRQFLHVEASGRRAPSSVTSRSCRRPAW